MAAGNTSSQNNPITPSTAYGRRLNDFGRLLSAEKKLLASAAKGENCVISNVRPDRLTRGNGVRAGFIRFLALGGDADTPVHELGLILQGAWIRGETVEKGQDIDLSSCTVSIPITLWDCNLNGKLVIRRAKMRTVNLGGSKLAGINGTGVVIDGSLRLRGDFHSTVLVDLEGATINGNLDCNGGSFEAEEKSISLEFIRIKGAWIWRNIGSVADCVDLSDGYANALADDKISWDHTTSCILEGFTYERFVRAQDWRDLDFLKGWLNKQPELHLTSDFKPQPFEQLANVLKIEGYEERSKEILIHKRRIHRRSRWHHKEWPSKPWGQLRLAFGTGWDWLLEWLVGYGYRPWRAVLALSMIWTIGALIFWFASFAGIMAPSNPLVYLSKEIPALCRENWTNWPEAKDGAASNRRYWINPGLVKPSIRSDWNDYRNICARAMPSEYSDFNALFYSIDIGVPLVEFRQQAEWAPRVMRTDGTWWWAGYAVRSWEWFEIGAGWVLSLLFVAAIGGIIRKE